MGFLGCPANPPSSGILGGGGLSELRGTNFNRAVDDGNSLAASLWHKGGFKPRPFGTAMCFPSGVCGTLVICKPSRKPRPQSGIAHGRRDGIRGPLRTLVLALNLSETRLGR